MKHTIQLQQASTWLLAILLSRPTWAGTEGDAYRGSKIVTKIIPDIEPSEKIEKAETQRDMLRVDKAWCTTPIEFVLTDRQRDTVKVCVKSYIEKKALASGPFTLDILDAFGLAPDGENEKEEAAK